MHFSINLTTSCVKATRSDCDWAVLYHRFDLCYCFTADFEFISARVTVIVNIRNNNRSISTRSHKCQQVPEARLMKLWEWMWGNVQWCGKTWRTNMFAPKKFWPQHIVGTQEGKNSQHSHKHPHKCWQQCCWLTVDYIVASTKIQHRSLNQALNLRGLKVVTG